MFVVSKQGCKQSGSRLEFTGTTERQCHAVYRRISAHRRVFLEVASQGLDEWTWIEAQLLGGGGSSSLPAARRRYRWQRCRLGLDASYPPAGTPLTPYPSTPPTRLYLIQPHLLQQHFLLTTQQQPQLLREFSTPTLIPSHHFALPSRHFSAPPRPFVRC